MTNADWSISAKAERYLSETEADSSTGDEREIIAGLLEIARTPPAASAEEVWRPIETAPTDETIFLIYGDGRTFVVKGSILVVGRRADTPEHLSMRYVTHWTPLPAPPREGQTEDGR